MFDNVLCFQKLEPKHSGIRPQSVDDTPTRCSGRCVVRADRYPGVVVPQFLEDSYDRTAPLDVVGTGQVRPLVSVRDSANLTRPRPSMSTGSLT